MQWGKRLKEVNPFYNQKQALDHKEGNGTGFRSRLCFTTVMTIKAPLLYYEWTVWWLIWHSRCKVWILSIALYCNELEK